MFVVLLDFFCFIIGSYCLRVDILGLLLVKSDYTSSGPLMFIKFKIVCVSSVDLVVQQYCSRYFSIRCTVYSVEKNCREIRVIIRATFSKLRSTSVSQIVRCKKKYPQEVFFSSAEKLCA